MLDGNLSNATRSNSHPFDDKVATMKPTRCNAFTLVEMLLVVAVIVLLIGMILPAMSRSKAQVNVTLCATHMRQWGVALANYSSSNAGCFPDNRNTNVTPDLVVGGQHVSWNSSVVQRFFREYLEPLSNRAKTDELDLLNCPTQKWHQINDVGLGGGLIGYFYIPFRTPTNINYTFAQGGNGNAWVAKKKMGGKYAYTPILIDMKQQSKSTNWWFNASVPFSSHIGNDGQPTDVNMLFEAGEVKTYKNEQVKLGADMGGWWFYYDPF